jgi:hypothetical protein
MSRIVRFLAAPGLITAILLEFAGAVAAPKPALTGCPTTTQAQNEALVRRWYDDIWTNSNLDVLDSLLSPRHVHHWATGPDTYSSAEVKERIAGWATVFPDMRYTIDGLYHAGGAIIARWSRTGTFLGPLPGNAAEWSPR